MTALLPLLAAVADPTPSTLAAGSASGGPGWLMAVNLLIWTGIFLYLLRLDRRLRDAGDERRDGDR